MSHPTHPANVCNLALLPGDGIPLRTSTKLLVPLCPPRLRKGVRNTGIYTPIKTMEFRRSKIDSSLTRGEDGKHYACPVGEPPVGTPSCVSLDWGCCKH